MEIEQNQSPHKGLKKGLYIIPTAFTAANIAMGFVAVLYSIRGFQSVFTNPASSAEYFDYASIAIALAMVFDTLDGRVARMTKTATEIGVQLDSLADVLTFGIAPIALVFSWAIAPSFGEKSGAYGFGIFLLFMYLMCGTFRLARFNLQATRPRVLIEGTPKVDKKNFVGLPIPLGAGMLTSIVHFAPMPFNYYGEGYTQFHAYLIMVLLAVLGLLMVSTIKYSSFKSAGTGKNNLYIVLLIAAVGMLIWLYSRYVLLALAAAYCLHGIIWQIWSMLRPRRNVEQKPEPSA